MALLNRMSAHGTSRHFSATQDSRRFQSEADLNRHGRPAASVANDPHRHEALRRTLQ
jgi:hypothetical protein